MIGIRFGELRKFNSLIKYHALYCLSNHFLQKTGLFHFFISGCIFYLILHVKNIIFIFRKQVDLGTRFALGPRLGLPLFRRARYNPCFLFYSLFTAFIRENHSTHASGQAGTRWTAPVSTGYGSGRDYALRVWF